MTDEAKETGLADQDWGGRIVIRSITDTPLTPGRRDFIKNRDLGVAAASDGKMSATMSILRVNETRPTGWHYHLCEAQFAIILRGWMDMQFEDGTTRRISEGDSLYLKGGTKHNEIAISEHLELIEILVPADIGSVPCDPPEAWRDRQG